jgi:hypothetical protein
MTEQEFYEHIAKNYVNIHKYALKYIKKNLVKKAWDEEDDCWVPDYDEWDGFDEHTDLNFWVNTEYTDVREETVSFTEMWVTAYLYKDGELISDVYVNICKMSGKKS